MVKKTTKKNAVKKPVKKRKICRAHEVAGHKRDIFVKHYLLNFNATEAAIAAGYTKKAASQTGYKLLRHPDVQEKMKKAYDKREEEFNFTSTDVLTRLVQIATANIDDFIKWDKKGLRFIASDDAALNRQKKYCVQSVKIGKGGASLKMRDTLKALELLGRHFGIFQDNLNVNNLSPQMMLLKLVEDLNEEKK